MKDLSKSDFNDWKENPVTQAFFLSIQLRIRELEQGLARTAGENPMQDNRIVGMILFAEGILSVDFEEINDA